MKKLTKVAVIVMVLFIILLPFLAFVKYVTIAETYSYFVGKLQELTGLNRYLANVAVVLWLVPLGFGLKWFLTPSLPFKKRVWYQNRRYWGAVLLVLSLAVWNISLYGLTKEQFFAFKEGKTLKWYALTPEGVKFFDRPGVDPVYGIPLKPVTPEVVRSLKLLEKGQLKPIDPRTAQLFNTITGEPQAWYYKRPDGSFEFFNVPGFHPATGTPLQPVTPEVYFEWQKSIAPPPPQTAGASRPADSKKPSGAFARGFPEEISQKDRVRELRSLVNRTLVPSSGKLKLAVALVGAERGGVDPESILVPALKSEKVEAFGGYLKPAFKSKGYFQSAFLGDTGILVDAGVLESVNFLLLGRIDSSFRKDLSADPNLVSCTVRLTYKVVNKAGQVVGHDTVSVVGAGFSEEDAFARALELIGEQYSGKILTSVS